MYLTPPLKGFPVEFVSAQGSQKTRVMGLSDGRKSFRIGLAVLIRYRSVTATHPPSHPASHVAVAITLYAIASNLKTFRNTYERSVLYRPRQLIDNNAGQGIETDWDSFWKYFSLELMWIRNIKKLLLICTCHCHVYMCDVDDDDDDDDEWCVCVCVCVLMLDKCCWPLSSREREILQFTRCDVVS